MNNKTLGLIFFVLLGLLIAKKTILKPTSRSFKQELTSFDSAAVDKVTIQIEGSPQTTLTKNGEQWEATNGVLTIPAKEGSVASLLSELSSIKTKQLVSRSAEKWTEYEVDEAKGKRIDLYAGGKKLVGLNIGRFNFNQQTRSGVSYARLSDEDDIYAIDGFLSMSAAKDFNSFRNNQLLSLDPSQLESISLESEGAVKTLSKAIDGGWLKNQATIDSTAVAKYIAGLNTLNGSKYNDRFSEAGATALKTLRVGDATVTAYPNPTGGFVMKSSQNDAYFDTDSTGIFKKAFLDLEEM